MISWERIHTSILETAAYPQAPLHIMLTHFPQANKHSSKKPLKAGSRVSDHWLKMCFCFLTAGLRSQGVYLKASGSLAKTQNEFFPQIVFMDRNETVHERDLQQKLKRIDWMCSLASILCWALTKMTIRESFKNIPTNKRKNKGETTAITFWALESW